MLGITKTVDRARSTEHPGAEAGRGNDHAVWAAFLFPVPSFNDYAAAVVSMWQGMEIVFVPLSNNNV